MCGARTRRFFGKDLRIVLGEPTGGRQGLQIRRMLAQDVAAVREILRATPSAADWSEEAVRNSLGNAHAVALVSERRKEISGCIFGLKVADEAEILNLVVTPPNQRQGEASELVRRLLAEWEPSGRKRIFLEVRESNAAAVAFYKRLGFQQVRKRKKYYSNPEEDALVLERQGDESIPQR
jgi:ribosomal-protein-alanine acetyltransferase